MINKITTLLLYILPPSIVVSYALFVLGRRQNKPKALTLKMFLKELEKQKDRVYESLNIETKTKKEISDIYSKYESLGLNSCKQVSDANRYVSDRNNKAKALKQKRAEEFFAGRHNPHDALKRTVDICYDEVTYKNIEEYRGYASDRLKYAIRTHNREFDYEYKLKRDKSRKIYNKRYAILDCYDGSVSDYFNIRYIDPCLLHIVESDKFIILIQPVQYGSSPGHLIIYTEER